MPVLAEKLAKALVDDPPLTLKEGGIFGDGFHPDLDALRQASREGKNWISHLQEREIAATGIKSLKVRYNSVTSRNGCKIHARSLRAPIGVSVRSRTASRLVFCAPRDSTSSRLACVAESRRTYCAGASQRNEVRWSILRRS
ncbi:MAG: hypothetical protein DMF26_02755 [Verrucomicrobia bacterium]|nr:MAG: hypothetical protein DMF26_02755 [Verrucomicrobiota bacterium]